MNSERIKTLAKYINKNDTVLDLGCDHGYLSIYLKKNKLCKEIYASDIKESALNMAKNNFDRYKVKIKSFISDGFNNIDVFFDTCVIAGMGTNTILNIIGDRKINKLILCSNNDHKLLRSAMLNKGYYLDKEEIIYENNHYYIIMLYKYGIKQKLNNKEISYGISNNKEYYNCLINKNKELIKKVPILKKIKLYHENRILKGLTERK